MAHSSGGAGGSGSGGSSSSGDTTYTKIFVGGLAWETHRDTMRKHFEQYGEILEAVVITDRFSGRSKGYGFVTFKDPESARKACLDPTPIIDGRRANCNLASLGQKHRQFYNQFGPQVGSVYGGYPSPPNPYGYPQGYGYPPYGYHTFPEGYGFPQGMYSPYTHPGFSPMPGVYGSPGSMSGGIYGGYSGFSPGNLQSVPGSPSFGASSQAFPQGQQQAGGGGGGQHQAFGSQQQIGSGSASGSTNPDPTLTLQQQQQHQQQPPPQTFNGHNPSQSTSSSGNNLFGTG